MEFSFIAKGHKNVLSAHKTTLEFATEKFLTLKGDCILGISASKSMKDMPEEMKEEIKESKKVEIEIEVNGIKDIIKAKGHPDLTFDDNHAWIIRKSNYVDERTLCIEADKASCDIKKELVEAMKTETSVMKVTIRTNKLY